MKKAITLLVVLLCCGPHTARGAEATDENSDLNLIPREIGSAPAAGQPPGEAESRLSGRAFIEDALTGWLKRGVQVPLPVRQPDWQNRTSLDLDYGWQFTQKARLNLSDRLNLTESDGIGFPSEEIVRNDLRELYISWEGSPRSYLEAGRINLKNGTALGYNPIDFLRPRSTVSIASIDPSALRENRLGSAMLKGQKIMGNGAVTVAYSPKLAAESSLSTRPPFGFSPLFGQTNAEHRLLAAASFGIADLSPQALLFWDRIGPHFGFNLTRVVGSSVVLYGEWAGASEPTLTKRAVAFGRRTGTLPQAAPLLPQSEAGERFRNDLSVGASWTSSFKLTLNLEYHYHQAGFSSGDFKRWIDLGGKNAQLAPEFWFVRQYASDQQEPLMQQEIFLRLDLQDVIPSRLNVGGVMFVSPYDGSTLFQASAQYFISRTWTLGLYLGGTTGGGDTVYGSLPWSESGVLQVVRYF